MITSGTRVGMLNGISIGSGAWSPRRGERLMVCAFYFLFFVGSLAQLRVKPLVRFWQVIIQNACLLESCIPFGVRTMTSQFRGSKFKKPPKIRANRHFPATMPKSYNSNSSESMNKIKEKFEPEAENMGCC